jgi:hypothetical protein
MVVLLPGPGRTTARVAVDQHEADVGHPEWWIDKYSKRHQSSRPRLPSTDRSEIWASVPDATGEGRDAQLENEKAHYRWSSSRRRRGHLASAASAATGVLAIVFMVELTRLRPVAHLLPEAPEVAW